MCKIHRHVSSLFLYTQWSGSILLPFCFLASGYIKWMIENRTSHANMTPSIAGECLTITPGMAFPHLFCFTSCLQLVLHALLFFCKFIIMQLTSWCFNQMQMGLMDNISCLACQCVFLGRSFLVWVGCIVSKFIEYQGICEVLMCTRGEFRGKIFRKFKWK